MAYRINEPTVVSEVIAGEAIVINLDSGNYYSMEDSAGYIWEQVISGADVDTIAKALAQLEGAGGDMQSTVREFVGLLLKESLIRIEEMTPALPVQSTLPAHYAPPKLNVFTDMQNLLLLDPIHQVDNAGWPHASQNQ